MQPNAEQPQISPSREIPTSFMQQLSASLITTLFPGQPFRAAMNRAAFYNCAALTPPAVYNSIVSVAKDMPQYWKSGIGWNTLRGGTVFGSQAWLKDQVCGIVGADTHLGKVSGVLAAATAGAAAATFLETPFIRATLKTSTTAHLPLMRFSPSLSLLYFVRELGFNSVMLGTKDYPHLTWYFYGVGVFATAICHKFISWDATADISEAKNEKIPNLKRDGLFFSIKAIAKGGTIYNQPACHGLIKEPIKIGQLIANFLFVSANPTILNYRGLFVLVFMVMYWQNLRLIKSDQNPLNKFQFFQPNKQESVPVPTLTKSVEMNNKI